MKTKRISNRSADECMKTRESRQENAKSREKQSINLPILSRRAVSLSLCALLLVSLCAGAWLAFGGSTKPDTQAKIDALYNGPFAQMTDEMNNRPASMSNDSVPVGTEKQGGFIQPLSASEMDKDRAAQTKEAAKTDRYLVKYKDDSGAVSFKDTLAGQLNGTQPIADGLESLTLTEAILPSELAGTLQAADAGKYIEFIQPDYLLSVQSMDLGGENGSEDEESSEPPVESEELSGDPETSVPSSEASSEDPSDNPSEEPSGDPSEEPLDDPDENADDEPRSVLVAVIDGSVDVTHPTLQDLIDPRAWNFVEDDDVLYDPESSGEANHGTHVSGIIAQAAADAGAEITLLPLRVFSEGTAYTSDILAALAYAEECGAEVINSSFGSTAVNLALYEALSEMEIPLVAAVGNARQDLEQTPVFPACYPLSQIIAVASGNDDSGFSYFSNYSPELVHLTAPGRRVVSTLPNIEPDSTMPDESVTGAMSGTSMSAAAVTGAAGAVLSLTDTGMTGVKDLLLESADRFSHLENKVMDGRRLNTENALSGVIPSEALTVAYNPDFDVHGVQLTQSEVFEQYALAGDVVKVAAGAYHTLVLKEDGTVWSWGQNYQGQCGAGFFSDGSNEPSWLGLTQVVGLTNVIDIAAGNNHSLAISDQWVYSWGDNSYGQLGNGTYDASAVPMEAATLYEAEEIDATANISLARSISWKYYTYVWGETYGLIPWDPYTYNSVWYESFYGGIHPDYWAPRITPGAYHLLALADNYNYGNEGHTDVFAWGNNGYGQLGDGTTYEHNLYWYGYDDENGYYTDIYTTALPNLPSMVYAEAGYTHNLTIDEDGHLWGWGDNEYGQVGLDNGGALVLEPTVIDDLRTYTAASVGANFSLALRTDRTVMSFGANWGGELGVGDTDERTIPTQILELEDIIQVEAGGTHGVALDDNGQVWVWGNNSYGQLGVDPDETDMTDTPFIVWELDETFLVEVEYLSAGTDHTLAIKNDGTVWTWGGGSISPVHVSGLTDIEKVAAGDGYSLALKEDGTVWAWGQNDFGQLGLGNKTDVSTPTQIMGLTGIADIAAGRQHAMALTGAGQVYTWGRNYDGQLGLNNTTDRLTPQLISGIYLSGVTQIAAGDLHSLALKNNGTVYVWGSGTFGQLGQGAQTQRLRPSVIPAGTLSDVKEIAAGRRHSLALTNDGTVFSWGLNETGQLGLGDFVSATKPQTVLIGENTPLSGVAHIEAGDQHSLAVDETGEVWNWGANTYHQLGDRTTLHSPWATQPILLRYDIEQVTGGGAHTLVLTTSGKVWAWGGNYDGQAGRPAWSEEPASDYDDIIKPMRVMRGQW